MAFIFKTIPARCQFLTTQGGIGNFIVSSAAIGKVTPENDGVIDGKTYDYYAQSLDGSQWEAGNGVYTVSTHTLARTTIISNSDVTLVPVNFLVIPVVAVFGSSLPSLEPQAKIDVSLFNGLLNGLTLSTPGASSNFSVAAGCAVDNTGTDFMKLAASITKTTGAWVLGTGNGALDTGSIAINTTYHVYEIKRPDLGTVDIAISLSASAPTLGVNIPAAYTLPRRIGSMRTDGSSHWVNFVQFGDEFILVTAVLDINVFSSSTAAITRTLTSIPTGVPMIAVLGVYAQDQSGVANSLGSIFPLETTNLGGGGNNNYGTIASDADPGNGSGVTARIKTNASAQIATQNLNGAAAMLLRITTMGWVDYRGK